MANQYTTPIPLEIRFWEKVNTNGPMLIPELGNCWEWTAYTHKGYGAIQYLKMPLRAHVVAWFLETGAWPDSCVLHKCDNPSCVRFTHLWLGTSAENNADRKNKGRNADINGEKHCNAKLTWEIVDKIRSNPEGLTQRALAIKYGISFQQISRIILGKRWRKE